MEFIKSQQQLQQARVQRETSQRDLFKAKEKLEKTRREMDGLIRIAGEGHNEANNRLKELAGREKKLNKDIGKLSSSVNGHLQIEGELLKSFSAFTDPTVSIGKLDDTYPLLMFPLRIETRFKQFGVPGSNMKHQLWVRAFPDEIAIDTFEELLSENEVRNARSYWSNMWQAGEIEADQRAAWRLLVGSHGSGRAAWISDHYKPLNQALQPERKTTKKINLIIATDDPPTGSEKDALKTFWNAMWKAQDDKTKHTAAWDQLVVAAGEPRAKELLETYSPFNFSDTPPPSLTHEEIDLEVAFIEFPKPDDTDTKYQSWTKAPTVNILPERLVFLGFNDDEEEPLTALGNPIPSSLATGPDPSLDENQQMHNENGELIVNEEMKWMVDFEEAVNKGMGFKINLSPPRAQKGFDRIFVLGVRMSTDKDEGKNLLETLIHNHHHSRKGFGILSQGTPTNNTEKEGSTYSWREDPDDSFDIYFKKQPPTDPGGWYDKKDGRWLAELLGIDKTVLQTVDNYYGTDQCEAKAMNSALWPATLGYFMENMMEPVFSDNTIEQTRLFFQQFVSGRGMIPAIRVGKQPYGIMPATVFSRMNWFDSEDSFTPPTGVAAGIHISQFPFLPALYSVLKKIDGHWTQLLDKVAHVGKKGEDAHQLLLDIVGLHPSSIEFYYRHAQSFDQIYNSLNLKGLGGILITLMIVAQYSQSGMDLLSQFGYNTKEDEGIPDILKKFFLGRSDLLKGPLIDDVPLSESDPVRIYTPDNRNYIQWLIDAAKDSHNTLRKLSGFTDNKPPTSLLFLMLQHALDLGYLDAGFRLHVSTGLFTSQQARTARQEPKFIHIKDKETDKGSRWQHIYKTEPLITSDQTMMVGDFIPSIIKDRMETAELRDQLKGLEHLKNAPTARLERVFTEHLDTCSYRLDSWMLGLVNDQLSRMRNIPLREGTNPSPKQGVYIGAYGWLEDVRSEDKKLTAAKIDPDLEKIFDDPHHPLMKDSTNGGYLHAPSLNHAVTAAVLRNGYISKKHPESFSINLSSERVRQALLMIEGIRSGQSLAALLGYKLERGMHDRHDTEVDEFIYDLRKAFPLVSNRLSLTKEKNIDKIRKIEARNVVDGLALVNHVQRTGKKNYPFGRQDLPSAGQAQRDSIDEEVARLLDINDAVSDLAIAEGVHQVVQGNYDRAAATLDAYGKGNFPPTPDVIKTPRSGVNLTHRAGLHFGYGSAPDNPANTTPRSKAEPAVNHWLSGLLPPMNDIVCVVEFYDHVADNTKTEDISMQALGLLPIDILYMVQMENQQAMSALEDEIVMHTIKTFTPRPDVRIEIKYMQQSVNAGKVTLFELAPLLDSLRSLIQRSRPLTAVDVQLSGEANKAGEADVSLDSKRITLVKDALAALNTQLGTFIGTITPVVDANNLATITANIDDYIKDEAAIFKEIARFGLPQTGSGSLLEWKGEQFRLLRQKIEALIKQWEDKLTDFTTLIADYNNLPGTATDEEKYTPLQKAELKISTASTIPFPAPDDYRDQLLNIKKAAFTGKLDGIKDLLTKTTLSGLYSDTGNVLAGTGAFELTPMNIDNEKKQLSVFAGDIKTRAENLKQELDKRLLKIGQHLQDYSAAAEPRKQVDALLEAGKVLLGDDFRIVPDFGLTPVQADEWQNAYGNGEKLLKYQTDTLEEEFPVDRWLYGIARVKEKMHHVENAAMLIEAFTGKELELEPLQLPFHPEDYWLALEYPAKKTDGTAFKIEEDKLLYTAHYTEPFVKTNRQSGLLIDEWTEVIPTEEETTGLTFHYDRPNSEPPQTLLLVTPPQSRKSWQWQDLVDALQETLDMAKKRAIEPGHVDDTDYARFLPSLISAVTVHPITAALNLALNNKFYVNTIEDDE
ncbi:MAG: hypothetical protein GY940_39510 [bacterium]|nr:hypothetical protein [bacterium]